MARTQSGTGDFTDAKNNKYDVSSMVYPLDLENSDQYGKHKVVFFINVSDQGKSSIYFDDENRALYDIPDGVDTKGNVLSAITGFGTDVANNVAAAFGSETKIKNIINPKLKRLASAIVLHMPNSLRTSWDVSWSEEDSDDFKNASMIAKGVDKAFTAFQNEQESFLGIKAIGAGAGAAVGAAAAAGISKFVGGGKMAYAQKATRMAPGNALAEQLFRGVNFREFEFAYSFAPRSPQERISVLNIIRTFRHHMLPEYKDKTNFMFIYPSEFQIKYFVGGTENPNIEKQLTAVLTSMSVDYTPNGQFNTVGNGMPAQINMTLRFKELAFPTKETSPSFTQGV